MLFSLLKMGVIKILFLPLPKALRKGISLEIVLTSESDKKRENA
jgi:hypothetical protein